MKWYVALLILMHSSLHSYTAADVERLKAEVMSARATIYGWCTPEKVMNFIDLTLEVKPDLCVEIGPYGGASFLPVAYTL